MRAIVLSGGGAKGSYQVGVWKALKRLHISYDIVTGTSIGALNGALMVQKDYRLAKKLWKTLDLKSLFSQVPNKNTKLEIFKLYQENFVKNGGMDISKIEEIIKGAIRPSKFYRSPINYGLVTYNLSNKSTEKWIKSQIKKEKLCDYLMASATCYPAFQMKEIDGDKYIDGGISDNMPINLALDMGADELIVVDLKAPGIKRKSKKEVPTTYITPHNEISFFLNFNPEEAKRNMKLGYNDAMKAFHKLEGEIFTFRKHSLEKAFQKYQKEFKEVIQKVFIQSTIPFAIKTLKKLEDEKKYKELFQELTEEVGTILKVEEQNIYRFKKYQKLLKQNLMKQDDTIEELEKNFKSKKFKTLLNTRWITFYLYERIKKRRWKEIRSLSIFFRKDVLRAIYLYVVIEHA